MISKVANYLPSVGNLLRYTEALPINKITKIAFGCLALTGGAYGAVRLLRKANYIGESLWTLHALAWLDNAQAQMRLAEKYETGNGVKVDQKLSTQMFQKALKNGSADAQLIVGDIFADAKKFGEAFKYYEMAAAQGNAQALYRVGVCYNFGEGVAQDYLKAINSLKKAEEMGNVACYCIISELYLNGEGRVPQDYKLAMEYAEKARANGDIFGCLLLAHIYYIGLGIEKNEQRSRQFHAEAAKGNPALAFESAVQLEKSHVQEAKVLYQLLAAGGHAKAAERLKEFPSQ